MSVNRDTLTSLAEQIEKFSQSFTIDLHCLELSIASYSATVEPVSFEDVVDPKEESPLNLYSHLVAPSTILKAKRIKKAQKVDINDKKLHNMLR